MPQYLMYSVGDDSVPTPPPTPELMAEMGRFAEDAVKAGVLLATGGFAPSASEIRLTLTDGGDYTVLDGPYTEAKELIGGWALVECRDADEAVAWAKRFLGIAGPGETRIRQVFGPGVVAGPPARG
ncbi:YciI family protein [Nakamurella endophytica]|uniref:YCII-related domain-containing protein n=1 Tax=Nakamurella endophytica TaxID=1748367 RepID=A0A917WAS7_9ACTN|nr:YciI family protein [Nakamurella endophytica]GGL89483.1 hypothetical protein GCM10011594_06360 [Nakamurella endophytica]